MPARYTGYAREVRWLCQGGMLVMPGTHTLTVGRYTVLVMPGTHAPTEGRYTGYARDTSTD